MPHNITSADKVRATGLKHYAEAHGWDYELLIAAFDKSLYDRRNPLSNMRVTFRKKDGRMYSTAWFYQLRKIYLDEKAAGAQL